MIKLNKIFVQIRRDVQNVKVDIDEALDHIVWKNTAGEIRFSIFWEVKDNIDDCAWQGIHHLMIGNNVKFK